MQVEFSFCKSNNVLGNIPQRVHSEMITSHSCCRIVGCTSMMKISSFTTSYRCSSGLWGPYKHKVFVIVSKPADMT